MKFSHHKLAKRPIAIATAAFLPTLFAGSAMAQSGLVLEEIIVTAQKKSESVQDVPLSIQAVSGDALNNQRVFNFEDVQALTPGLQLNKADARRQTITMRGITADPDNIAAQPITVYWNEQNVRQQIAFTQVYDLERMEVLKGPQGTLQGKTSPGGAISMYTKKVNVDNIDGYVQQTFSDNNGSNTQFATSLPIVEGVFGIRLAGVYDDNEGQQYENITNGQKEAHLNRSARLTMDWVATDNLDLSLTYQLIDNRDNVPEPISGRASQGALAYFGSLPEKAYIAFGEFDPEDRVGLAEGEGEVITRADLTNLRINWNVAGHTFTSITGNTKFRSDSVLDRDRINVAPIVVDQNTNSKIDIWVQELRVVSDEGAFDGFWEYTGGIYYENSDSFTENIVVAGVPQAFTEVPIVRETKAIFTHNTFNFTDTLNLQVGVRYQEIRNFTRTDVHVPDENGLINLPLIPDGSLRSFVVNGHGDDFTRDTNHALTGTVKLSWFVMDDAMAYIGYDRSFRPSGITITPTQISSDLLLFDEEFSDNFELGFKSTLLDGSLRLNGALFYQKYDGYQARIVEPIVNTDASGNPADEERMSGGLVFNQDATIQGAELAVDTNLTETWFLGGGVTYTDARFDSGEAPCSDPGNIPAGQQVATCDVSGQRVSAQPLWNISMNSEYFVPFSSVEWYVRGNFNWRSEGFDPNAPGDTIADYGVLDMFTGFRSQEGDWLVELWSKNITDVQRKSEPRGQELAGPLTTDFRYSPMIPGRVIGITARYDFEI